MNRVPPTTLRIGRWTVPLPLVAWLTVIWLLMWDRVSLANALSGVLIALVLVLVFPMPPLDPGMRLNPLGLLGLAAHFTADLLRSAGPLAWHAFGRAEHGVVNSVIAVGLRTRSDFVMTTVAIGLSATPGLLVLEVRRHDSVLYLHVLGGSGEAAVDRARRRVLAVEERVVRAFGTRADRRALEDS